MPNSWHRTWVLSLTGLESRIRKTKNGITQARTVGKSESRVVYRGDLILAFVSLARLKPSEGRVANTSGGSYHPAKAGIFMLC